MTDRITSDSTYLSEWHAVPEAYPEMRKHMTMEWLSNLRRPDRENAAPEYIDVYEGWFRESPSQVGKCTARPVAIKNHLRLVP